MSKPALTLWQRLKQLLSKPSTQTAMTDSVILDDQQASKQTQSHDANDPLIARPMTHRPTKTVNRTKPRVNAAFDEAPVQRPMIVTYDAVNAELDTAIDTVSVGELWGTRDDVADKTLTKTADSRVESFDEIDGESSYLIPASDIEALLETMGYHFVYHPVREGDEQHIHHFTMQVSDKTHEWGCMIRYFGEQQLIAAYSILPFQVAESHRAEMLAVIAYLNYDLMIGNLEMDLADGELRFKTSLDLEVTGVNELVLSYLLQSNFSLISRLYDTLEDVVKQSKPIDNIDDAVKRLINSQQSKEFFLMSEAIQ